MALDQNLDTGHTAFMFICMALVQFMTPGLAFFYGGLVGRQNVLTIIMQSYVSMGVTTLIWYVIGFSLCFGDSWRVVGDPFTYLNFKNVPIHSPLMKNGVEVSPGIPGILYAGYQCMFAIISPPLMSGAFADRFRFQPYIVFISLWILLIYAPVCHWIWGGGWLSEIGVVDWAGGIVVHTTAGFSALASLFFVGRRGGQKMTADSTETEEEPHNVPFVALGTGMLWFGWYGFNGGDAYLANGVGVLAAMNSQLAASAGAIVWLITEVIAGKKPGLVSFCVGAIAGLATVTPAAGYIQPSAAVFLGMMSGIFCWFCVKLSKALNKFGFEDALDVWGVHGMGGVLGSIMLGLMADGKQCADAQSADTSCANPGTVTRSPKQFMLQFGAAGFVALYSFALSYGLLKAIGVYMPIVPKPDEQLALDVTEHGESAYTFGELSEPASPVLRKEGKRRAATSSTRLHGSAWETTESFESRELTFSMSHYDGEEDEDRMANVRGFNPGLDSLIFSPRGLSPRHISKYSSAE